MARKAETFKVNTEKKTITIYTNVKAVEAETITIRFYLEQGYTPLYEEKKATKTTRKTTSKTASKKTTTSKTKKETKK